MGTIGKLVGVLLAGGGRERERRASKKGCGRKL